MACFSLTKDGPTSEYVIEETQYFQLYKIMTKPTYWSLLFKRATYPNQ